MALLDRASPLLVWPGLAWPRLALLVMAGHLPCCPCTVRFPRSRPPRALLCVPPIKHTRNLPRPSCATLRPAALPPSHSNRHVATHKPVVVVPEVNHAATSSGVVRAERGDIGGPATAPYEEATRVRGLQGEWGARGLVSTSSIIVLAPTRVLLPPRLTSHDCVCCDACMGVFGLDVVREGFGSTGAEAGAAVCASPFRLPLYARRPSLSSPCVLACPTAGACGPHRRLPHLPPQPQRRGPEQGGCRGLHLGHRVGSGGGSTGAWLGCSCNCNLQASTHHLPPHQKHTHTHTRTHARTHRTCPDPRVTPAQAEDALLSTVAASAAFAAPYTSLLGLGDTAAPFTQAAAAAAAAAGKQAAATAGLPPATPPQSACRAGGLVAGGCRTAGQASSK